MDWKFKTTRRLNFVIQFLLAFIKMFTKFNVEIETLSIFLLTLNLFKNYLLLFNQEIFSPIRKNVYQFVVCASRSWRRRIDDVWKRRDENDENKFRHKKPEAKIAIKKFERVLRECRWIRWKSIKMFYFFRFKSKLRSEISLQVELQ